MVQWAICSLLSAPSYPVCVYVGGSTLHRRELCSGTAASWPQGPQLVDREFEVQTWTPELKHLTRNHTSFSQVRVLRPLSTPCWMTESVILTLWRSAESPHGLTDLRKYRVTGPTPRGSGSLGLGRGLRLCVPSRFPGGVDDAGPGPVTFGELPLEMLQEIVLGLTLFWLCYTCKVLS